MKRIKTISRKTKNIITAITVTVMVSSTFSIFNLTSTLNAASIEPNYAKALQYSQYMYDANMCGTEVGENSQYVWRDDCHTYDAELKLDSTNTNMSDDFINENKKFLDPDGDGYLDVAGGYHDAGDHVKFGMPQMYSASTLGWGYYEFKDAYVETKQDNHIETILKYFNDYFMKVTYLNDSDEVIAFCYQVGDGDVDHAYWQAPEIDEMFRRGWFATKELPSTDCISAAAASLAANYMNFREKDPEYAEKSLKYAKALFSFAQNTGDKKVNNDGPKGYYQSSKWEDDYCWAAAWLYLATEEENYLEELFSYLDYYAPSTWTHCWNDVWAGTMCLVAEIDDKYDADSQTFEDRYKEATNKSPYEEIVFWSQIKKLVDGWASGQSITITPGGYAFLNQWGSARYNTATQLCALVYDKHHENKVSECSEWAKGQMTYIMGDNPMNRSYIVGYDDISAKYPHHRAASGLSMAEDKDEHRYVLYGALVGGPDADDNHIDATNDYIYNEVAIDYNAAFVGACAGLYHFFGDSSMEVTSDFPPAPDIEEEGGEGTYWVEAFGIDVVQDGEPKVNELAMYVRTDVTKPSKNISVRYYYDVTGMKSSDINDMTIRELYDQTSAETEYDGVLSGPHVYKDNIHYVEIKWDGYSIANSNKKYEFVLGTYTWQNSWDPTDDWSYQDLKIEEDSWTGVPERNDNICVYDDGVLVGGIEPAVTQTPIQTVTPIETVTPSETEPTETSNGEFDVEYIITTDWGSGATVNVELTNNSLSALNTWSITFDYSGNETLTNSWSCEYIQEGSTVILKNNQWNSKVNPGETVSCGFNIEYTGTHGIPTDFVIN